MNLEIIREELRLNRVNISNLPIQEYAEYLIEQRIGIQDFLFGIPTHVLKQSYFMENTYALFDTVIGILLDENLEYKEKIVKI